MGELCDIGNYRQICLVYFVYQLFTPVTLNGIGQTLDEGLPYGSSNGTPGESRVTTQQTMILRDLYKNFTKNISPSHKGININVKRVSVHTYRRIKGTRSMRLEPSHMHEATPPLNKVTIAAPSNDWKQMTEPHKTWG
ncbi:unnamed protein product [Angiostrongylus costaricensis]|uniref:HTH_Tnp_Tc3_2 domain-containing protein n=1 Tax=Angiostrongylus costaricensis TaxID=334426 RepID=A0A0R3Q2S2_ANGCS|nr:unnamed protein product [Angiostrongylus costaricensis]